MKTSRRTFVLAAGSALASTRVWGANDRVPVAVVGLGGRGRDHMNEYLKIPQSEIVAVCDANQAALERGQATVLKAAGKQPKGYGDMREVFADKDVVAVSMPLPNHWHALATIWACQAGKDVYIEKPACHNIYEGTKMVEAARKYNRMVQVGSQSRSIAHKQKAMKLLHAGEIGKLYMVRGLCYRQRKGIGVKPDQPTPAGVNWDMFLGPAPMRPFNENRFAYNWHWFWDTGNGDIGNQGVHEMDIALWGFGPKLPKSIQSSGGRYLWNDQGETPNTQVCTYDYGDAQIVFEVRNLPTNTEADLPSQGDGSVVGNIFYGTDGVMAVSQRGFQVFKGPKREKTMDEKLQEGQDWDTGGHMRNFLDCVKSRKQQDLTAEVEIGVRAAVLCHLGNIAYRVGRRVDFDPEARRFWNDVKADAMTTRDYRKGYVVPETV